MDSTNARRHNERMDTAFISAFSALAGSIFGGLTSGTTTWLSLRSQARAGHRMHNVAQREDLYRDFIIAASQIYGNAITNSEPKIQEVVILYGMISRMRVLSSPRVVACAEKTMNLIIDAYFAPNRTVREVYDVIKSGHAIDPLKIFSDIARDELQQL
jgi:hypothetical protein